MHAELDKKRNKNPERQKMFADADKKRDQTPKRQKMHANVDKKRDQNPERKKMHSRVDRVRNQTQKRKLMFSSYEQKESRIYYTKKRRNAKYQEKLISTLKTDTGFDIICSSCLQYKNRNYCKLVSTLNEETIKKFIIKKCSLLRNRSDDQFVCNLCLKDIKRDKLPKRSHKNSFKFANFPDYLLKTLKKNCRYKEKTSKSNLIMDDENYDRQQLKLNKLESHLLKLCIPFIRIGHCPRGRYFKIKGDLILISSDIEHSLSKILPIQQSLIPVSFKRKLSYTGAYIEEFIEREKVKIFYSWLKKHNHLFKDVQLDSSLIDNIESEVISKTDEFGSNSEDEDNKCDPSESESLDDDFSTSLFHEEPFTPTLEEGNKIMHDQTTLFLNKYCEDTDVPTVANRLADAIVDYEVNRNVPIENQDDFDIDDENITEEQYLKEMDGFEDAENENIKESTNRTKISIGNIKDELSDHLDTFVSPSEGDSNIFSNIAKGRAKKICKKMETICVAPGESGKFQNWGKEVFLEEQCFPEKFPYGTGGYLSSCVDNPENEIGFANYCVNQILSCDPKFRNDSCYIFFLLLVKELIQLKRCKSTYFRQATRLPNLSKDDVINMDSDNLSRYNRSFQVFKSLRGTSMYYEECKKNLMAHLRSNGCPSVFLTLSCAEFDWPELLKEILETVYRKKVTQKDIDDLSSAEKNKIISENVVQTTLHFQRRIEKIYSLMKYDFFNGSKNTYHVSSYFYRIEFQQRGAPHVHSLLWLKNEFNEDAPNIWSENLAELSDSKKREVEEFTDLLIKTSPNDIFCEYHEDENVRSDQTCEECNRLREKVKKYQSHNHTFTCEKKRKTITIKEDEGHGRLDGRKNEPILSNITVCGV